MGAAHRRAWAGAVRDRALCSGALTLSAFDELHEKFTSLVVKATNNVTRGQTPPGAVYCEAEQCRKRVLEHPNT